MDFLDEIEKMPESEQEILAKKVNNLLDSSIFNADNKQMLFKNLMMILQNNKIFKIEE